MVFLKRGENSSQRCERRLSWVSRWCDVFAGASGHVLLLSGDDGSGGGGGGGRAETDADEAGGADLLSLNWVPWRV